MNGLTVLLIALAVLVLTAIVIGLVLPLLKKRGVDVSAALDGAKQAINAVDKTLDTIRPFLAGSPGVALFDKILAAAATGVANAEQLYHIGELDGDKRKREAEAYILKALALMGVEVTPDVEKLIDGAIEAEVLNLGHAILEALPVPDSSTESATS